MKYLLFVNKDLIHFSNYDVERSIPNMMDGQKISQRKIRGIYGKDIAFILEKELKKLSQFEKISPEDLYYYLQNSVLIDDTIHFWSEKQTYNVTKFEIKHCEDEFDWMKCNELFFLAGIIHESLQFDSKNSIPLSKLLNLTKDSLKEKIEILEISKLGLKQMQKYNPNLNFFEYENF